MALLKIAEEFLNDEIVKNDMNNFNNLFKYPQSYHITSFFAGEKKSKEIYYTDFVEDLEINIKIEALVYVPECIITGICFPDQKTIKV